MSGPLPSLPPLAGQVARICLPELLAAVSFSRPTTAQAGLRSILAYQLRPCLLPFAGGTNLFAGIIAAASFSRPTTAQAGLR